MNTAEHKSRHMVEIMVRICKRLAAIVIFGLSTLFAEPSAHYLDQLALASRSPAVAFQKVSANARILLILDEPATG